jgi:16S rRNA (cytidine1402-2'-O)-methyltransferase
MPQRQGAGRRNAEHTGRTRIPSVATTAGEPNPAAARSKPRELSELAPGLYLVATPIGNVEDITLRALKTLGQADVIVCEDTRVSAKLLARHGIERPLLAYHEHNAERMRPLLLERLKRGERMALISDAGTPLVSDPGFKLVRAALAENLPVTTLPGPSAALAALVLSGLPSDRFLFAGFLPPKTAARRRALAGLQEVKATLVFFESGPRLGEALADMAAVLGERDAAVARELTKLYEEVRRGALAALAAHYAAAGPPRGELVVVVGPPATTAPAVSDEALDHQLAEALGHMSIRDASAAVAAATGKPRREVYARALLVAGRGG